MVDFGTKYPQYLFEKNKGYGTREHLNMIQKYGVCDIHRLSFNLGPTQQPQGWLLTQIWYLHNLLY